METTQAWFGSGGGPWGLPRATFRIWFGSGDVPARAEVRLHRALVRHLQAQVRAGDGALADKDALLERAVREGPGAVVHLTAPGGVELLLDLGGMVRQA